MAGGGSPVKAVLYAFAANFGIAIAKTVAFVYTGSSSMLAEAIHSFADTGNQLLLLLGLHRSKRAPDVEHPLGYGKASYFLELYRRNTAFQRRGAFLALRRLAQAPYRRTDQPSLGGARGAGGLHRPRRFFHAWLCGRDQQNAW